MLFPESFLWGVSTSAHQFEGGSTQNQWHAWEQSGRIRSGDCCAQACDWWSNAEHDLNLCRDIGLNAIRISLDWARIEPVEGRWDLSALRRYRELLQQARERGMQPFVTLHHFTHPVWFESGGGFLHHEGVEAFLRYAQFVIDTLGDLCSNWITFNEPNVYAVFGYVFGEFPPGLKFRIREAVTVLANMHLAHALAYDLIHKTQPHAQVGLATNWVEFHAATAFPSDKLLAYAYDTAFNRSTLQLIRSGSLPFPLSTFASDVPEAIDKADFIGLNVYNRLHVRSPWDQGSRQTGGLFVPEHVPQGDHGVELPYGEAYPDAIVSAVEAYSQLGVPMYIMENGVPDREDRIRPWVLVQSINNIGRAIRAGRNVRGYFHWSIVDNFEWNEGWTLRFGLYGVDPATQKRWPRPSAAIYRDIIRANSVSDELIRRFAQPPQRATASASD